ncbi:MAG: chromosome partition protein MukE [Pseudomonadota bacterium]|nr:chromosome partition protein MukE [Pseudomonadota bacterium]
MSVYANLAAVIEDRLFPSVDVRLREGCHLCTDDREAFAFVTTAYPFLERLYERYGYDLVRAEAGYVYLKPNAAVRQAKLSAASMLVGQALAALLLDPAIFALDRRVYRARLIDTLQQVVGEERLLKTLKVTKKSRNATIEAQNLRREVDAALRTLEQLGFVRLLDEAIELRTPLYRFVEAVKGAGNERAAMDDLLAGEVGGTEHDEPELEDESE